ncbi:class I SAM-dependent methyltransferase [Dactylosporangium sp. CA-092794]|uniref:class I SAM-dependent methyltransferase n=1 Tax=Dactylosporangium sp. CA-092794 TaxID=3239929 RepID=UPI003D92DEBB
MSEYLRLNRAQWDERAPAHAASPGYNIQGLLDDPGLLSEVVRFDRPRLGDVAGLRAVHLQCHIGTDTLSLHRLGARITGLDFSPASLAQARDLAARAGADIDYVEADVYRAAEVLEPGSFDLVYTGVGALCWLPDIRRWAAVVAALLRPGGRLFIREGHPMLWSIDETRGDGVLAVHFAYFERPEPLVWDDNSTYVETEAKFTNNVTHQWNHGLGEIVTALLGEGLELTMLQEHDTCPWNPLPGFTAEVGEGEYRLADRPERLPLTYTLQARKRSS